jgi:hypothetical protein
MLRHKVLRQVVEIVQPIAKKVEQRIKEWMKPATDSQKLRLNVYTWHGGHWRVSRR